MLAEDHGLVRAGLAALLAADRRCTVAAQVGSVAALTTAVHRIKPDLLVLDVLLGQDSTLDVLGDLERAAPAMRVIVLTLTTDTTAVRRAFSNGVHGYLLKDAAAADLVRAVDTVMSGGTYLYPELGARLADDQHGCPVLSDRESDVLALLARGHTNSEIAATLFLGLRTVEAHRSNVRTKLGVRTRAELVRAASKLGLLV